MEKQQSLITEQDDYRLRRLVEAELRNGSDQAAATALLRKLDDAKVLYSEDISDGVITVNSRFRLKNASSNKTQEYKLVYPGKADEKKRRISVLSPLGIAVLGRKEGDEIDEVTASATRRYQVVEIMYQPEATPA